MDERRAREPLSTKIVRKFLDGPLPVLIIVAALAAGAIALLVTPREEEPQIVVPLADIHVAAPGLSAEQVERQIATRLEKLLYQIDGVEYVYSMSRAGGCVVTVRFYVGEDRERSLVRIYNKLHSNLDQVPREVSAWVVKPVEIDDVPIVIATLWSRDPSRYGLYELRRLAEEMQLELQAIEDANRVEVVGGRPRRIRIELDPDALAARRTTVLDVKRAIGLSSVHMPAGEIERADRSIQLEAGTFLRSLRGVEWLVVNVVDGVPVYLRDVGRVIDGPAEAETLTWFGLGPAATLGAGVQPHGSNAAEPGDAAAPERLAPAVHISIAKKRGTNAVRVAERAIERIERLSEVLLPPEVGVRITRNYGDTAQEKVDELVEGLAVAMLTVVLFLGLVLGWRAALVIALAIPVCYGATLLINLLAGYTINRVTLFALILALGLLVDDPITDVENIERYFSAGRLSRRRSVLQAVQEVRPALIMGTLTIILSFLPLFFITGMMGPYMAPMAINVPLTVGMSLLVAFCVTPFLSFRFLKHHPRLESPDVCVIGEKGRQQDDGLDPRFFESFRYRLYDSLLRPMLRHRALGWAFLGFVGLLFAAALVLPLLRKVPLKMLPFDNKNELQVVIDMPEGTTLERTDAVARALASYLLRVPEVADVETFAGLASPMDFNGMVRHYYLRREPHLGELRVSLAHKDKRRHQSHEIALRVRRELSAIAERFGAAIKIVEVPPGPPVISTLTAEIYGDEAVPYRVIEQAAERLAARLRKEPFVVDVDTTVEAAQERLDFVTDKEKAALSGVATADVAESVAIATAGLEAATLEIPNEVNPLPIVLRLPRALRSDPATLRTLQVRGRPGVAKERRGARLVDAPQPFVALGEIGSWVRKRRVSTIYHKNLERVAYVMAEVAGRPPADAILDVQADQRPAGAPIEPSVEARARPLEARTHLQLGGGLPWSLPAGTRAVWTGEGEWKITLDAFRDLGIAFGVANVAIFFVLWLQTASIVITLILMTAIPLTMIGIMPGFWLLNQVGERVIAGFPNPTFFTATAMIGMIALAGIVVRNSLVLVDFVHRALKEGCTLEEALVRAGAIRLRPILLTAGTTFLGNIVITLDPVFSGLAWAIIFGIFASTLFTLGVIPVIYNLVYANKPGHGLPPEPLDEEEEEELAHAP